MEGNWWARSIRKTKNKSRDRKTKKVHKIKAHKIRIESIKDTTSWEAEELRIGRINKVRSLDPIAVCFFLCIFS